MWKDGQVGAVLYDSMENFSSPPLAFLIHACTRPFSLKDTPPYMHLYLTTRYSRLLSIIFQVEPTRMTNRSCIVFGPVCKVLHGILDTRVTHFKGFFFLLICCWGHNNAYEYDLIGFAYCGQCPYWFICSSAKAVTLYTCGRPQRTCLQFKLIALLLL